MSRIKDVEIFVSDDTKEDLLLGGNDSLSNYHLMKFTFKETVSFSNVVRLKVYYDPKIEISEDEFMLLSREANNNSVNHSFESKVEYMKEKLFKDKQ